MHSPRKTRLLSCLFVLGLAVQPLSAIAQQPFNYYPAYGAHRGRMVYHQGPFGGTRQKIHWGGGITDNGAAVLTSAIGAAATIFGPGSSGESAGDKAARDAEFQRSLSDDQDWLTKAKELQSRTEALRNSFLGIAGPPEQIPGAQNGPPPQSGPLDTFDDWDSGQ
jgi:hypothetical protein